MSSTRCPSCRRALALRDHLRGERVQCPMCGTVFDAPEEPAPAGTIFPASPVTQAPGGPPPPAPAADFDPDALRRGAGLVRDDRASLRSAARWLQVAVAMNAIIIVLCSSPALLFYLVATFPESNVALLGGVGLMVLWSVLLFVMGAGPRYLRELCNYRLARACGHLACVIALAGLAQSAFLAWEARGGLRTTPAASMLLVLGLVLWPSLIALVAGLKTLSVLSRPEVKRSFR